MKTPFSNIIFLLLIIPAGVGALSCSIKKPAGEQQQHVRVTQAQARVQDYPMPFRFSGKLEAGKQSNLSTRIMGQVEQILVKPGQRVNRGEVLLKIRNQDILAKKAQVEATMVEAQSSFENAKKDLARFEALYKSNSTSDKEMDDIRTRYEMAKARLDAVRQTQNEVNENLLYTALKAPYHGVITGKFVQEGDLANPGMPLLSIENPDQWQVTFRVPEEDISRVSLNAPVKVHLDALGGLTANGVIVEINPSSANTGPQFEAKVLLSPLPGNEPRLYSGIYATVDYEHGTQSLLLVPVQSLIKRGQMTGLYTVGQEGAALLRWIRTGKTYGDSVEVLSGLADGEQYIVSAESRIFDGALIQSR
ncbi:MAG: efflux RND transporter periplasmic adaptor subunit [Mangrovibacterium sp.]|nr:efflux RND transporter periplasmic adaptor subunit [Mangrovibacterium sp.]